MVDCLVRISRADHNRGYPNLAGYHRFQCSGENINIETSTGWILIIGEIQHKWFYSPARDEIFDNGKYDESFYRGLNGHFSLIVIDKFSDRIRLVSNRSGGNRLYFTHIDGELIIANRLKRLRRFLDVAELDPVGLKELTGYRWTTGERGLLSRVTQLPPGQWCDVDLTGRAEWGGYWQLPRRHQAPQATIPGQANTTEDMLGRVICDAIRPGGRVAVLLSGGVDSSVLAAIARNYVPGLVALSHASPEHGNPELATAMEFSRQLGIEHRVIEIDDSDVLAAFQSTVEIIEQPPRNQSSVILFKIFESVMGEFDQIIYGEGADTLFGSNTVKRYWLRAAKRRRLSSAMRMLPFIRGALERFGSNGRILDLLRETPESFIASEQRLAMAPPALEFLYAFLSSVEVDRKCDRDVDSDHVPLTSVSEEPDLVKALVMVSDVANHFHEAVALARRFDIDLISPFVDSTVMQYAAGLDNKSYYGDDYVKPILRRIGEKYYVKELMYIRKIGFPAPHEKWLETVLGPVWNMAKSRFVIQGDHDRDGEFRWTMAGLAVLFDYLEVRGYSNLRRNS